MATIQEKLAESLAVLKSYQDAHVSSKRPQILAGAGVIDEDTVVAVGSAVVVRGLEPDIDVHYGLCLGLRGLVGL